MTGIDRMLDGLDWERLPEPETPIEGLYATHIGYLTIMDIRLKCYVLNDGRRVFDADQIQEMFQLGAA